MTTQAYRAALLQTARDAAGSAHLSLRYAADSYRRALQDLRTTDGSPEQAAIRHELRELLVGIATDARRMYERYFPEPAKEAPQPEIQLELPMPT